VGRLAFGLTQPGATSPDIYSVRPDGAGLRQLTDDPGFDACAAYNARGDQIAFCSDRLDPGGVFEIWTMRADGASQRQLTNLGGRATFPDFSPHDRRVAFQWRAPAATRFDVWTIRSNGSKPRQLTNTPEVHEQWPAWSPTGRKIAFIRSDAAGTTTQLWLMDRHGRHQRQLTFDTAFKDQLPDWQPDGMQITYMAGNDIWLINPDGTGQTNITNTPHVQEYGTAWSPDGQRIAYLNLAERRVHTMRPDGTDVQPVGPVTGLQFVPGWQAKQRHQHHHQLPPE
jgi:Tol biopolymer transport system component